MTITFMIPSAVLVAALLLVAILFFGSKVGCRTLSGCLIGLVCILVGLILWAMSGVGA
jgi:uncharacterized membrane protein